VYTPFVLGQELGTVNVPFPFGKPVTSMRIQRMLRNGDDPGTQVIL